MNEWLADSQVAKWEDEVEDVFLHNLMWETGNFRVFQGLWESSGFYLQETLDALFLGDSPPGSDELKRSVFGLLRLSESIANAINLPRWTLGGGRPHSDVQLPAGDVMQARAAYVGFSNQQLSELGIEPGVLAPFVISDESVGDLGNQEVGNSSLERHPLICCDGLIIVALPNAISVAIRVYVVEWLATRGMLGGLERRLRAKQSQMVLNELRAHLGVSLIEPQDFPERPAGLPDFDEILGSFDVDKLCHVLVIPDTLGDISLRGLGQERALHEISGLLSRYISEVVTNLRTRYPGTDGFTLFIIGGMGRGVTLGGIDSVGRWKVSSFSVGAFWHLARTPHSSLLKLWKLKREEEHIEQNGIVLFHPWGDLNLLAYWQSQRYTLISRDVECPGQACLAPSYSHVTSLREDNDKNFDFHSILFRNGVYRRTCRVNPTAFFEDSRRAPVYGDLEDIRSGTLRGVVETSRGAWWLSVAADPETTSSQGRRLLFGLWNAFLSWLGKLSLVLGRYPEKVSAAIHIVITVEQVDSWQDLAGIVEDAAVSPSLQHVIEDDTISIRVPKSFRSQFNRLENIAERMLLESIARGVLSCLGDGTVGEVLETTARSIVAEVMPNDDMRIMHFFEARDPGTQLAGLGVIPEPRFINAEDQTLCRIGMASRICPSVPKGLLTDKTECLKVLNNGVDKLWEEIKTELGKLNRLSLLSMSLANNESLLRDKAHWAETSRALMAIHSPSNVHIAAHRREVERIRASLANRVLVEMAICAAPAAGGLPPSRELFDQLSAWIITLIEMAYWSDAIQYGLAAPKVRIWNNGFIEAEQELAEVLSRYGEATFREQFHQTAEDYPLRYEASESRASILERERTGLDEAFKSEYGVTISECYDIIAELWECAIERSAAVVAINIAELRARLSTDRAISEETIRSFISSFGLHPRERWDRVPSGFDEKDFWPWRYQRKLSLSMRPLVIADSEDGLCIYGIQTVGQSFDYVLGRIREGWLTTESVRSVAMKAYIGAVADENGEAFELEVATFFPESDWQYRHRVPISSLGGPTQLGDIDVLVWRRDGTRAIAVECKRLKPARTVGEIGEQLSKFKGEARDLLIRHMNRLEWLNSNSAAVLSWLGIQGTKTLFEGLLVTNVIVPMQYVSDLPLPQERILPLGKLSEFVGSCAKSRLV